MNFPVGKKIIGDGHQTYIIAEMSGNHGGKIGRAIELIRSAKSAGADAVKVQVYTADTITIRTDKSDFQIASENAWAKYKNLHELYSYAYTPWEWMPELFDEAKRIGIEIFASVFDRTSVDLMEKLGVKLYKIASPEIVDLDLIRYVAQTQKPVVLSTGISTLGELAEAIAAIKSEKNDQISVLKCTTAYPTPPEEVNLATVEHMRSLFGCVVGFSDHTEGIGISLAAVALGAKLIEKHFKLDEEETVDSFFSLNPYQFTEMVQEIRRVEKSIGVVEYLPTKEALKNRSGRRSLYVSCEIKKGQIFTVDNIRSVRPGYGLEPRFLSVVLDRKATRDLSPGDRLCWEDIGGF